VEEAPAHGNEEAAVAASPKGRKSGPASGGGGGQGGGAWGGGGSPSGGAAGPGTTGRFLVLLREDGGAGAQTLNKVAGLKVATTADFSTAGATAEGLGAAGGIVFEGLGVAVVDAEPDQVNALSAAGESGILAVERERIVHAIGETLLPGVARLAPPAPLSGGGVQLEYVRGYRDALVNLYEGLTNGADADAAAEAAAAFREEDATWGLQAVGVPACRFTGRGIRVAVLDTGFDAGHPDFVGRAVSMRSFIEGEEAQDGHGHGTHCIGTALGGDRPATLPRYGVACHAEIFSGKVLSNAGSGSDAGILAGIQWAVANGCAVVSMSLGAPVGPGATHSRVFETAARRALRAGTLIIAAAGNESERPGFIAPVGHPANCPSIMAVAALDSRFQVAPFSCGGLNPQGGQVDIAGPGVAVRSSWPRPLLHRTINGTSMATPHVSGVAALYAEADPDARGRALMSILVQSARRLELPGRDVGAGLVQAP
jgi:subtilisin family serine protease